MTLNDFERQTVPPHLHALAARARAALGRFTTYPGTALRIEFGGGQSAFVAASIETEDADGTGRQVCVQKAARLNLAELGGDIDAQLGALAREALIQLFTHEVDEWLRIDGARCRQPHPDPIRGLALHPPKTDASDADARTLQTERESAKRADENQQSQEMRALGDERTGSPPVAAAPATAARALLEDALTGTSMDALRQLTEVQRRSFFSLLALRREEPGAPSPEEVQGLLELVTDHLSHPAL